MSSKFILSHKNDNGEQLTLDDPISPRSILNAIIGILALPNTHIIQIKRITDKQIEERALKWFMETMDDEENSIILTDAIFDTEGHTGVGIWPFKKIKHEDIPEELTGDNKRIAKWVWNNASDVQKEHIIDLQKQLIC